MLERLLVLIGDELDPVLGPLESDADLISEVGHELLALVSEMTTHGFWHSGRQ